MPIGQVQDGGLTLRSARVTRLNLASRCINLRLIRRSLYSSSCNERCIGLRGRCEADWVGDKARRKPTIVDSFCLLFLWLPLLQPLLQPIFLHILCVLLWHGVLQCVAIRYTVRAIVSRDVAMAVTVHDSLAMLQRLS